MSDVLLRLILFGFCLICCAFFSGSETALFSLGRVKLARLREEQHPKASLVERLLGDPRRLIATIFIGNELVNVAGATLMASVLARYEHVFSPVTLVLLSTAISVPLILLLGEITPKNIAQQTSMNWALRVARPLDLLANLFAPLRLVVEAIADGTIRLVGRRVPIAQPPTDVAEGEFRTLVEVARHEGQIDPRERHLIHRVLELGNRTVAQVMTGAEKMFALSAVLPMARILEEVRGSTYSRVPIFEGTRDHIIGILHAKDLLGARRGLPGERRIRELLHEPFFVPPRARCDWLLREFRRQRFHLALVVDEYGHAIGLVTLEDILEEVFGEIVDEKEPRRLTPPPPPDAPS